MTNNIDLFQPEHAGLALPAATTAVFIDGTLCEDLEPTEIIRNGWPEFSRATLTYNPAARYDANVVLPEQIEDRFGMGQQVSLRQLYNQAPPNVAIAGLPLFVGQIEGIETMMGSNGETVNIVAKDFSAVLQRITVYGRRVVQSDGSTVFLSGLDTTFNPGGQPNAAVAPVTVEGKTYTSFCGTSTDVRQWSYAGAIHYLLTEYVSGGQLYRPDIEQLCALTENRLARDLDVTGLSVLEALHCCSQAVGLQFHFVPRLVKTGPRQAIVFCRRGHGCAVELNRQPQGEPISLSRTNVGATHSKRDFYPVTHRYIGRGDFKVYEATFELVKAWDPALEDTDYARFSASTNPQFHMVRDVHRKWCLNEAGDYADEPYNQGQSYDFSKVFEGGGYVRRRRRFWPALSTDSQGKSLGYFLEVSFDDGLHWWGYLYAFNNLLGECGIWLSSDQLDVDTWVAALKGVLKFRISASVVSDERLTCIVADGPVGSTVPVVDHVITLPRQFRYRKVSAQSVLSEAAAQDFGAADEADDSVALHECVRQCAAISRNVIEAIDVQTPTLALHFHPGDRVTSSPESRDLLNCRRDSRSLIWIERVHVDFRNQCTNLKVVRQRS